MPLLAIFSKKYFQESLSRDLECLVEGICKKRISLAVEERDDMWRRHEKAQIAFLQKENSQMLTGLHAEIERLHNELRGSLHF